MCSVFFFCCCCFKKDTYVHIHSHRYANALSTWLLTQPIERMKKKNGLKREKKKKDVKECSCSMWFGMLPCLCLLATLQHKSPQGGGSCCNTVFFFFNAKKKRKLYLEC